MLGSQSNKHSKKKKIIMPVKCDDSTHSSGTAFIVHFERQGASSSEVSFATVLLNNLSALPSLRPCRTLAKVDLSYSSTDYTF